MSAIAIFAMECCQQEIAHGRFRGDDMYPPAKKMCPFGCDPAFHPNGRHRGHVMRFVRYEFDDTISLELLKTCKVLYSQFQRRQLNPKERGFLRS